MRRARSSATVSAGRNRDARNARTSGMRSPKAARGPDRAWIWARMRAPEMPASAAGPISRRAGASIARSRSIWKRANCAMSASVTSAIAAPSIHESKLARASASAVMRRGVLSIFARAKNASARASAPWRSRVSSGGDFLSAYAPAAVVSLNTRLLPPLRTSSIAVIAAGASRSAAFTTAPGTLEDGGTDCGPVGGVLEWAGRVAREQDLAAAGRHVRVAEHLGEVVDENLAVEFADAADFGVARVFEKHLAGVEAEPARVEESLPPHPAERAFAQVGFQGIVVGEDGLVADDVTPPPGLRAAAAEEIRRSVEEVRVLDTPAVDQALQLFPQITVRSLAQEPAFGGVLSTGEIGRQKSCLLAHGRKGAVVGDERIVEIDADSHRCAGNRHNYG